MQDVNGSGHAFKNSETADTVSRKRTPDRPTWLSTPKDTYLGELYARASKEVCGGGYAPNRVAGFTVRRAARLDVGRAAQGESTESYDGTHDVQM